MKDKKKGIKKRKRMKRIGENKNCTVWQEPTSLFCNKTFEFFKEKKHEFWVGNKNLTPIMTILLVLLALVCAISSQTLDFLPIVDTKFGFYRKTINVLNTTRTSQPSSLLFMEQIETQKITLVTCKEVSIVIFIMTLKKFLYLLLGFLSVCF